MEKSQSKVALITGANKGIGLETARGLGKMGIAVIIGSRDLAKGEKAVKELLADGVVSAQAFKLDVNSAEDHQRVTDFIKKEFGKLDILVNNAGVVLEEADFAAPGGFNTVTTLPPKVLRETFETNFFNVVTLTQVLLPLIKKSAAGRIVNVSSILGSLTLHADKASPIYSAKAFAYDASKTALNAFTVHLAQALRETNIKVNSAHPGWVKTDLGGENATLELSEGGKTSVELATLPDSGPSGGYFHLGQALPW
ncbi:MAG: SDR family oxidoreductase [Planctomycetota bacterium]|nr:SDR family oxidoreductase [Planctomycetota bacterium]